jgi:hypothetical protein
MKLELTLGALIFASVAMATPAIEFDQPTVDFTNGQWSLGFEFKVGATDLVVTGLGFYDDLGDGLTESHEVGIFDSALNLVVSGTVTNADSLSGHFRYTSATALLQAGEVYQVVATTGSENYTWNPEGFIVAPDITYLRNVYTSSNTLVPGFSSDGGVNGYFGANFTYEPVPEPASMVVLGLGALAAARRRRA